MRIINFLIFILAIPPAILSTIQLLDTSIPIISPIYNSIVRTASEKVVDATGVVAPQSARQSAGPSASGGGESSTADMSPTETETSAPGFSLQPVHIGIAAVSVLVALAMLLGLRRRAA